MNLELFLQRFSESLDLDYVLDQNMDLSEVEEWDSLGALSIIAFFDEYALEVSIEDVMFWQTPLDAWYAYSKNSSL